MYDHTLWKTRDPVRSPIDKPERAKLVVGSVTTGESLVLYMYIFEIFLSFFSAFIEAERKWYIKCIITIGDSSWGQHVPLTRFCYLKQSISTLQLAAKYRSFAISWDGHVDFHLLLRAGSSACMCIGKVWHWSRVRGTWIGWTRGCIATLRLSTSVYNEHREYGQD